LGVPQPKPVNLKEQVGLFPAPRQIAYLVDDQQLASVDCAQAGAVSRSLMVPRLIVDLSGSKSQPGSGVPVSANANGSDRMVNAPSVTFLQKSGPTAIQKREVRLKRTGEPLASDFDQSDVYVTRMGAFISSRIEFR